MLTVTRAGAIVLPAMPGWYHRPRRLDDVINFVVGTDLRSARRRPGSDRTLGDQYRGRTASAGIDCDHAGRARRIPSRTGRGSVKRCRPPATPRCLDLARVVLLTGASAGIGAALARELARQKKARAIVLDGPAG